MTETILEFVATAIKLVTTASDMRRRFFLYGLCLLFIAVSGAFLAVGIGFFVWALYDGLSVVLASSTSARLFISFFCLGATALFLWIAKKLIA